MAFLSEPDPIRLVASPVMQGIQRMVAPNPGPMTYHGTNSWLVREPEGLVVIDPGPDDAGHVAALAACGSIVRIMLTHTHPDHVGGAAALRAITGARIHGWGRPWLAGFRPDVALGDGEAVGRLTALHTPGHASDHLCFSLAGPERVLFSGDHVMSWSTSVVSPPDGDMGAYMASLRRLLGRDDGLYLCGHGAPLPRPHRLVRAMLSHRMGREASIVMALAPGSLGEGALLGQLYPQLAPHLAGPARRMLLAHLEKLRAEGRVVRAGERWALS